MKRLCDSQTDDITVASSYTKSTKAKPQYKNTCTKT